MNRIDWSPGAVHRDCQSLIAAAVRPTRLKRCWMRRAIGVVSPLWPTTRAESSQEATLASLTRNCLYTFKSMVVVVGQKV